MTTVNIDELVTDVPLFPRQLGIVALIGAGKNNDEIARELHISVETVKTHIKSIYRALGIATREQSARVAVALYAIRCGLVEVK